MKIDPSVFLGIAHFTVPVKDIEIAERFYVGLLGGTVAERVDAPFLAKRHPDTPVNPKSIHLSIGFGDTAYLALFVQDGGQPEARFAHPHIAIHVRPEIIDPFMDHLKAANVPFIGPARRGGPGQVSVYFNDPWGTHLEFLANDYPGETVFEPPRFATLVYEWNPPAP
jgi:catechol 2,3-dioxygenase-like lactoylglutathione lyase family enzyme